MLRIRARGPRRGSRGFLSILGLDILSVVLPLYAPYNEDVAGMRRPETHVCLVPPASRRPESDSAVQNDKARQFDSFGWAMHAIQYSASRQELQGRVGQVVSKSAEPSCERDSYELSLRGWRRHSLRPEGDMVPDKLRAALALTQTLSLQALDCIHQI